MYMYVHIYMYIMCTSVYCITLCSVLQNNDLQLKLTRSRNKSMLELDKGLQERSEKFERFEKEKLQLIEHNKQLRQQLDKAENENAIMHTNRQEQENELKELRENKQLLNQWERQIHDIIQWVSEEKDARYIEGGREKRRERERGNLHDIGTVIHVVINIDRFFLLTCMSSHCHCVYTMYNWGRAPHKRYSHARNVSLYVWYDRHIPYICVF